MRAVVIFAIIWNEWDVFHYVDRGQEQKDWGQQGIKVDDHKEEVFVLWGEASDLSVQKADFLGTVINRIGLWAMIWTTNKI